MSDAFLYVQTGGAYTLAGSGAAAAATSITLTSFLQIDGTTTLTMANFGTIGFATLEPGNSTQEEQISFSGITQNANGTATLTGVKTVLFVSPYTQTSGLAKSHPGGSKLVISNTAAFYDKLSAKSDDETITGLWEFPNGANTPILGTSYVAPTLNNQVASKGYADSLTFAGAPDASLSQKGIVQLPSQSSVDNKTATGSTAAALVVTPDKLRATKYNDYVVDTGTSTAYAIAPSPAVTQYVAGLEFTFKATHANNSTTPTLAVNGLSAKTIRTSNAGAVGLSYIRTNSIVGVVYDGTDFQITSVGRPLLSQEQAEIYATSTTGNTAYVVGLVPAITSYTPGLVVNFKPDTGGGHPTINVNSLGAKDIKKYSGGAIASVEVGDIVANQIASVIYDGTQFQLINQLSSTPKFASGVTTKDPADASAVQSIAHGLGKTPKYVKITTSVTGTTGVFKQSTTVYDGVTQSSQSNYGPNNGQLATDQDHFRIGDNGNSATTIYSEGVVTFDATNINISWTKVGSPGSCSNIILWEAIA